MLVVENVRGRPKTFVPIVVAGKGSRRASQSTIRKRSAAKEKLEQIACSPSKLPEYILQQHSNDIWRNKEDFFVAASNVSIKILNNLQLKQWQH